MQMMHEKQTKLKVAAKENWSRSVWAACKTAKALQGRGQLGISTDASSPFSSGRDPAGQLVIVDDFFLIFRPCDKSRIEWQTGGQNLETCEKLTWEGDQCQKNSNHTNCKTQIQIQFTQIQKYKSHKGLLVPQFWNRQGHISAEWENAINKKRNRCHKYKTRSQPENICGKPLKNHTQTRSKNNVPEKNQKLKKT